MNSSIGQLDKYRKRRIDSANSAKVVDLFKTTTLVNTGIVKVYMYNNKYCLIKISNNRIYRIGPSLMEILITNIPSNWKCINVYKGLTLGNLAELYDILFKRN